MEMFKDSFLSDNASNNKIIHKVLNTSRKQTIRESHTKRQLSLEKINTGKIIENIKFNQLFRDNSVDVKLPQLQQTKLVQNNKNQSQSTSKIVVPSKFRNQNQSN